MAERLAELYRRREFARARAELFAPAAFGHALEAAPLDRGPAVDPVRKAAPLRWSSLIEHMHFIDVDEPLVAGNRFALTMALDATVTEYGRRTMEGLCGYYLVAGDKILSERIFYNERA